MFVEKQRRSSSYELPSPLYRLYYSVPPVLVRTGAYGYLSSRLSSPQDKHSPICLTKAQIFQGPPHHTPESNQTVYRVPFVMYFPLIALELDLGATGLHGHI